ncbi:MAG: hypothetical protein JW952_04635 [Candidatus Eisenbacteria bacterium]|nr:hypothetical protein [Candidatus Eisenbacteria bacterium]
MANNLNRGICLLLLGLAGVSCLSQRALADEEPAGFVGSPLIWLAAGVLVVDAGATVANGAALVAGKPNRENGMFGVVLGSASLAASAVGFVFADGESDSVRFSLVLAGCGLASLLTGYLNVRAAGSDSAGAGQTGGIVPRLAVGRCAAGRGYAWTAAAQVSFW